MPEQLIDVEALEKKDLRQLDETLRVLWEKARHVSDVLLQLKTENKELQSRISSLELKEHRWTEELQQRDRALEDVRAQLAQAKSNGNSLFSKEELEALKSRLKELIVKINSRL